jgi:membrane protein
MDRLMATRAHRAWNRYRESSGNLLAAGVSYYAFFSIFPALALAFAIFGFVLQGRPDLVAAIADSLNKAFPGMIQTPSNPDGIISIAAPESLTLTLTGIIAFVTLLFAGLGWVRALRTGIRGVFGLRTIPDDLVRTNARDLFVLATVGLAVAVSAILTSSLGGLADRVPGWLGVEVNGLVVALSALLIGVVFDTLILVVLLRVLSGAPLPMRDIRQGAVIGAVVLTLLKLFGGFIVSHATANPLLGAVALSVGLLFWLDLMSKIILISAAWAANDVDLDRLGDDSGRSPLSIAVRPVFVAPAAARADTSLVPHTAPPVTTAAPPATGGPSRSADRVSLAAGAVLGAFATLAVRSVRRVRRQ